MHTSMSHPEKKEQKPKVRMYGSRVLFKVECPLKTISEFPSNLATFISL